MATLLPQKQPEGTYTFASQPRAVQQRKKYRDPAFEQAGQETGG